MRSPTNCLIKKNHLMICPDIKASRVFYREAVLIQALPKSVGH